jgi:hypothetical protein
MDPEKLLEGDEVAREAGIGGRVTLPQRGDNGRPMGGADAGDVADKFVVGLFQAAGTIYDR